MAEVKESGSSVGEGFETALKILLTVVIVALALSFLSGLKSSQRDEATKADQQVSATSRANPPSGTWRITNTTFAEQPLYLDMTFRGRIASANGTITKDSRQVSVRWEARRRPGSLHYIEHFARSDGVRGINEYTFVRSSTSTWRATGTVQNTQGGLDNVVWEYVG